VAGWYVALGVVVTLGLYTVIRVVRSWARATHGGRTSHGDDRPAG
jgi:hypothetical protein